MIQQRKSEGQTKRNPPNRLFLKHSQVPEKEIILGKEKENTYIRRVTNELPKENLLIAVESVDNET